MHVYVYVCMYVFLPIYGDFSLCHASNRMHACIYVCMYVCMHVCMCVFYQSMAISLSLLPVWEEMRRMERHLVDSETCPEHYNIVPK
jgi:hypothetical protein